MSQNEIRQQQGFTLIEVIISVAIMGFIALGTLSLVTVSKTSFKAAQDYTNGMIGGTLGERTLANYFKEATLSYNAVKQADNSWTAGGTKSFWAYFSDCPIGLLAGGDQGRGATLTPTGVIQTFDMIVNHWQYDDNVAINYDPVAAYSVGPAGAGSGALTYRGINHNGYISNQVSNLQDLNSANHRNVGAAIWQQGAQIAIYSPITVRPVSQPVTTEPRAMEIVGIVQGNDLSYDDFQNKIAAQHPMDPTIILNSFDTFFRTLPAVGGGSPYVLLRRVDLVELAFQTINNRIALISKNYLGGGTWAQPQVIAMDVNSLQITRLSSAEPVIQFQLVMDSEVQDANGQRKKVIGE